MRVAEIVTAAILMAVAGVVIADAVRLGFRWAPDGPESGFFPFWLAVIMAGASAAIVVQALRRGRREPFVTGEKLALVLKVLAPAAGMVLLTHFVGLYVASAIYMAFYMRWVGRYSWAFALSLPVAVSVATFVVFEKWFLVPLPKGPLESFLGY